MINIENKWTDYDIIRFHNKAMSYLQNLIMIDNLLKSFKSKNTIKTENKMDRL